MSDNGIASSLSAASILALPILIAIPLHEAAHGLAAWHLGDDTAHRQGRVTLNPLRHIDLFGTIALPVMLLLAHVPFIFGYAKPVPVNFQRLRHPRRDMVLVAAAGPAMNILLAVISAGLIHLAYMLPDFASEWAVDTLYVSILLNLILAVFNMIPIPPLDGGRVAVGLLPRALAQPLARLERFGMGILLVLIIGLPLLGEFLHIDLNLLLRLLLPLRDYLYNAIVSLTGVGDKLAAMGIYGPQ
jgi:Zn-dependent protease